MVIRRTFSANIFSKIESLAILLARLMTQCWHGRSFINVKKVFAVVNMRWIGEAASSEVRQAYKQLIGAVVQFMDQETPSEEFHEVVLTLYRLFSSQMAEDDIDRIISDKKLELTKLLGHTVADANLRVCGWIMTLPCRCCHA